METKETYEHPSFILAKSLPEPWIKHFPKSLEEAKNFKPYIDRIALATRVLVVAKTRVECAWAAYCDAVPGYNHDREYEAVLKHGTKIPEKMARVLFPRMKEVPYAY